jgi:hypothetical protein
MAESYKARKKRLIKLVTDNCVVIDLFSVNNDAGLHKEWCEERFGPRRPHHPIYEAYNGWLDYFTGAWAYTYGPPGYDASKWVFWFENEKDMVEFKLSWK